MRRLAISVTTTIALFSSFLLLSGSTAFAQETTQSTTNTPSAETSNTTSDLVSQILSATEQSGIRIIVIDGTTQQGNSGETNFGGTSRLLANGSENPATTSGSRLSFSKIQSGALEFREILKSRLAEIPDSITKTHNELRRKSPTGDLHPYIHAVYWSILLLAFGAWLEHQIYIKHIVTRW